MTTTRPRTRRSSKDSGPMVLVFPECLPQEKAKAKAKVRVRVRDAEVKVRGKVKVTVKAKVRVKAKVKVKEKVKVKVKATEKAKVKVRVSTLVQVRQLVMVVSSVGRKRTGQMNVPRPVGDHTVLRLGGLNSAGTKRP